MSNPASSLPLARKRAISALILALASITPLSAATYNWDAANTANGATIDAGSGTWSTSAANTVWNDGATNVAWTQTSATAGLHSAVFGGPDAPAGTYTVTLGGSVAAFNSTTVPSLLFSSNGYVLTAPADTNFVLTGRNIAVASGKTATLSGPFTFNSNVTGVTVFSSYGTLQAENGVRITTTGNATHAIGSKVVLNPGSTYNAGGAVIVGGQSSDGSTTLLTVAGGALNIPSAANLVLANVNNSTTFLYSNTIVTLSAGSITNANPTGGIRFGGSSPAAGNNSNVNGTINLDGGVLTAARIHEGDGLVANLYNSTLNLNGGTLRVLANTTFPTTFLQTLNTARVKAGGAFIDTNGASVTIAQPLVADTVSTGGGLTKLGAGTLTLTGANTFEGPTTVSAGTLAIAPNAFAPSAVTVADGARLLTMPGATAASVPAGVSVAPGGRLGLDLGSYNPTNVTTPTFTTLDATSNYSVDLTGSNIPVGTYTVLSFGSKTGGGSPQLGSLPPGVTATVAELNGNLVVNVLTPQLFDYVWSAGTGGWDTTTANWTSLSYVEGALATFPNLAGDNTVTLTAPRSPFSATVQNTFPNSYTFTGASLSGSASVTKAGTGVLSLATANSYSGATNITGGLVVVGADSALGSIAGSTTVASGSSLLLANVNYAAAEPLILTGPGYGIANTNYNTINGSYTGLRGALVSIAGNSSFAGPITIGAGATRFGVETVSGASLTLSGTISPAAGVTDSGALFRAGNEPGNFITLSGPNNFWHANTYIFSAVAGGFSGLRLGIDNALPITSSVVASGTFTALGTTLDLNGFDQTLPGLVESEGNLQIANLLPGSTSILTLDTTLRNYSNVAAGSNNENELAIIADGLGTTALVKKGSFRQTLDGSHSYTGPTTIEAGTLAFTGSGALQASPVTMLSGSTLDVSAITASGFALPGGLAGSGTLTATAKTVTVSAAFAPGALSVAGNLTLAPGTATTFVASSTLGQSSAVTATGALVLDGTLAITGAAGFDFASGQTFTFATAEGGITTGFTSVTANGNALTESTPDVWTGSFGGLIYTFTESTGSLAITGGISPLQTWRNTFFPGAGNDGTGIGANDADADGDGISNLVEYATNTSPIAPNPSPVVQTTNGGRLALTFTRIDDPKLTYTVEGRNDLSTGTWGEITAAAPSSNPTFGFIGTTPGVTETITETVIDSQLISATSRRFIRLSISIAP